MFIYFDLFFESYIYKNYGRLGLEYKFDCFYCEN